VQEQRVTVERSMVVPEEKARQRSKEADRELGVRPPGDDAAIEEDLPVGVADEVVEVEGSPRSREGPSNHRRMKIIVEDERREEGRKKEKDPQREDDEEPPARHRR
jgi:hypothetical protein